MFFFAICGFHKGCTLSANLATPKKVGITVRHVQLYLHWACQKMLQCENIGAEKGHKLRYFRSKPNTSELYTGECRAETNRVVPGLNCRRKDGKVMDFSHLSCTALLMAPLPFICDCNDDGPKSRPLSRYHSFVIRLLIRMP